MSGTMFKTHPGTGSAPVQGITLVASDNFSARYDLDLKRGVFSRKAHKLYGESYVDRILVLNAAKGGVATAWMLRDMAARGLAPKALLLNFANPIMVQGAAFADMPLLDGFDVDITQALSTGQEVRVDPLAGTVGIL